MLRLAPWTLVGATLILIAGFGFADGARIWLWVAALLTTYVGAGLSGSSGWRVLPTTSRSATASYHHRDRRGVRRDRHRRHEDRAGRGGGRVLGLLVATSFWLAYFDFFSIRAARTLAEVEGPERAALSRDLYAYTHLPMIVGIVLFAFSMKVIVGHVGDELDSAPAFALCGGSALYLLAYSAIRSRIEAVVA